MKDSVAATTCAIGRPLLTPLPRVGHEVVCTVRSAKGTCRLRQRDAKLARPFLGLVADGELR